MESGNANILLVDDDPQIVRALLPALAVNGFDVTVAVSGQSAMSYGKSNSWNAAVVDLGLPDMDGRQVVRYLVEQRGVSVIVISAQHCTQRLDVARAPAVKFLQKPFRTPELIEQLRRVLAEDR